VHTGKEVKGKKIMKGGKCLTPVNWESSSIKSEVLVVKEKHCSLVQRLVDSSVTEIGSVGSEIEPSIVPEAEF
jgi:hypothetical protein